MNEYPAYKKMTKKALNKLTKKKLIERHYVLLKDVLKLIKLNTLYEVQTRYLERENQKLHLRLDSVLKLREQIRKRTIKVKA